MRNQNDRLRMRRVVLVLGLVVSCLSLCSQGSAGGTAPSEVTDHRVEFKIDKRVVIAPEKLGVSRAMMSMVRHPDGTIFLNTQNKLFKSCDNGQTWPVVPVKLNDVPPGQTQIGIGVTRGGRLLMVHQDSSKVGGLYGQSLYVSYSDDGGKTWKKSPTDFGKIPPGIPNMQFHEDGVRTFIEQPDGTLMFTTTITAAPDYRKKYPAKNPPEPPNYGYGGTGLNLLERCPWSGEG